MLKFKRKFFRLKTGSDQWKRTRSPAKHAICQEYHLEREERVSMRKTESSPSLRPKKMYEIF